MAQIRGLKFTKTKGGPGSGNFGHAGRPGQVGGSASGGWRAVPTGQPLTLTQQSAASREFPVNSWALPREAPQFGGVVMMTTATGIVVQGRTGKHWEIPYNQVVTGKPRARLGELEWARTWGYRE